MIYPYCIPLALHSTSFSMYLQDRYRDQMKSIVSSRNDHTGPKRGQGPGPIVFYCANPVPCTDPVPVALRCE